MWVFERIHYFCGMIYILAALIFFSISAFFFFRKNAKNNAIQSVPAEEPKKIDASCCGAHEVCEFDEDEFRREEIVYFNDEELDELSNLREDELTSSQIDELREVLYTLRTDEIGKWLISIGRRHIHLPAILQQEARQLMAEN